MKKDNFDLRDYLVENMMTENSRGETRHHLGETVLDTRLFNTGLLVEMQIPADPDQDDPDFEADADRLDDMWDAQKDVDAGLDECGDLGFSETPLDEAGYTDDDEDDWTDPDALGDDDGGASLLDLVGGRNDKGAKRARGAAAKDMDPVDDSDLDAPVADDVPVDEPDADAAAGTSDPNAEAQPGLSAQIKYNPSTVEMEMDNAELDQYLSGFRRPQVAVNVLNRAIRTAQAEVNDSIGLNHLYLILQNGFYETSRTAKGQVIAKISADQAWREKNFG